MARGTRPSEWIVIAAAALAAPTALPGAPHVPEGATGLVAPGEECVDLELSSSPR